MRLISPTVGPDAWSATHPTAAPSSNATQMPPPGGSYGAGSAATRAAVDAGSCAVEGAEMGARINARASVSAGRSVAGTISIPDRKPSPILVVKIRLAHLTMLTTTKPVSVPREPSVEQIHERTHQWNLE